MGAECQTAQAGTKGYAVVSCPTLAVEAQCPASERLQTVQKHGLCAGGRDAAVAVDLDVAAGIGEADTAQRRLYFHDRAVGTEAQ